MVEELLKKCFPVAGSESYTSTKSAKAKDMICVYSQDFLLSHKHVFDNLLVF